MNQTLAPVLVAIEAYRKAEGYGSHSRAAGMGSPDATDPLLEHFRGNDAE